MINLSDVFHFLNDNQNVIYTLDELINPLKELCNTNLEVYLPKLGNSLHNLGIAYTNAFQFDKAEKVYKDALLIRTQLSKFDSNLFSKDLLTTQMNLLLLSSLRESYNKIISSRSDAVD